MTLIETIERILEKNKEARVILTAALERAQLLNDDDIIKWISEAIEKLKE